jgi:hypothetical protein
MRTMGIVFQTTFVVATVIVLALAVVAAGVLVGNRRRPVDQRHDVPVRINDILIAAAFFGGGMVFGAAVSGRLGSMSLADLPMYCAVFGLAAASVQSFARSRQEFFRSRSVALLIVGAVGVVGGLSTLT